jgi:hypothetical protein
MTDRQVLRYSSLQLICGLERGSAHSFSSPTACMHACMHMIYVLMCMIMATGSTQWCCGTAKTQCNTTTCGSQCRMECPPLIKIIPG